MCHNCDREVAEMGVLESDLPNLPFKTARWYCMVEGCKCKTTIRDYGLAPIYWWPVKVLRLSDADGTWRGGWTSALHGYICSRHFKEYRKNRYAFCRKHARTEKSMLERVVIIDKKSKQ